MPLAIRAEAQDHLGELEGSPAILLSTSDQTARPPKSISTLSFCQLFEGFQSELDMHSRCIGNSNSGSDHPNPTSHNPTQPPARQPTCCPASQRGHSARKPNIQAYALAPGANAAQIVTSNGIAWTIGNQ
jgi:hypothetical protein